MNYIDLKAQVSNWMHRTDLDVHMDIFSQLAEAEINTDLRVKEMEVVIDVTFSAPKSILPADYLEMRSFSLSGLPATLVTGDQLVMARKNQIIGDNIYTIHGGQIDIASEPTQLDTVQGQMVYFSMVEALSTSITGVSKVLDGYPLVYLAAMLVQANSYVQDNDEMAKWKGMYAKQIAVANKTAQSGRFVLPTVR